VTVISVSVGPRIEFETAFAAMMKERPDAFAMTGEPFHQLHIAWIIEFVAKNRLRAMYQLSENVRAGGLMSYGASEPDLFRRAGGYVHKILSGHDLQPGTNSHRRLFPPHGRAAQVR
jgi:ABC-type uncharacterized transport system substrate-binding protein